MKKTLLFPLALVLAFASVASASTIYGFSGTYNIIFPAASGSVAFTLTAATPPLVDTTYTVGPQLTCSTCSQVEFIPDTVAGGLTAVPSQAIVTTITGVGNLFFYFSPGTFTTLGTYSSILLPGVNDATLSVGGGVPEPSTLGLSLLGGGLLIAAALLKLKAALP